MRNQLSDWVRCPNCDGPATTTVAASSDTLALKFGCVDCGESDVFETELEI